MEAIEWSSDRQLKTWKNWTTTIWVHHRGAPQLEVAAGPQHPPEDPQGAEGEHNADRTQPFEQAAGHQLLAARPQRSLEQPRLARSKASATCCKPLVTVDPQDLGGDEGKVPPEDEGGDDGDHLAGGRRQQEEVTFRMAS